MAVNFDEKSFFDGTSQTAVTQKTWADYWRGVIPDGVVAGIKNELKPTGENNGMTVFVDSGACMADNHRGVLNSKISLSVTASDPAKPRIDIIVARVRYANTTSSMELDVKTGTAGTSPTPPDLVQTGSIYEIKLAEIHVAAGMTYISPNDVTDCRNLFECGNQSFAFTNTDSTALKKGMIVTLDSAVEGGVKRCKASELPVGVVQSATIAPGGRGQIDTKPGTISEITCDTNRVQIGDALVVGSTPGEARPGGGFAAGLALQEKAANVVGNVKSLLTVFSKIPFQNAWYLTEGIGKDQVVAAYQFVNRMSETEALRNINNGEELPLTKQSASRITWSAEDGYRFGNNGTGEIPRLTNDLLQSSSGAGLRDTIQSAVFGFKIDTSSTASYCGGIAMGFKRKLVLRGYSSPSGTASALNAPAIATSSSAIRKATSAPTTGVLGGNWNNNRIYIDGTVATNTSSTYSVSSTEGFVSSVIGQLDMGASSLKPFYVTAVVFYRAELSQAQHAAIATKIAELGGLS